jgi:hypothetical protein
MRTSRKDVLNQLAAWLADHPLTDEFGKKKANKINQPPHSYRGGERCVKRLARKRG